MISYRRIYAIVLRHMYNLKNNFDRMVDTFYWPTVDMILFGLTVGAFTQSKTPVFFSIILGICLWFVVWRSQSDITVNLLEEFWSDNLANIFAAPITIFEWLAGLLVVSIIKLSMTLILLAVLAYLFYAVNVTAIGWLGMVYILSLLLTGWWFGLLSAGMFMRHGTSIQTLAWSGPVILMPLSGTYFPVSSLPQWVQTLSKFLPSSYIFESMRSVIYSGEIHPEWLLASFALNGIYLALAAWFFMRSFARARENGIAHLK